MKRRDLLKSAGLVAVAASGALAKEPKQSKKQKNKSSGEQATPQVMHGEQSAASQVPPSEKLTVGVIGVGGMGFGMHIQKKLVGDSRFAVAAVCDVDRLHRERAGKYLLDKTGKRPAIYDDFRKLIDRKDIDAVLIATPDHWHTLTAIAAMEAGKDVYCEKPLSLTVAEGKAMVATARRYGTVFQVGSQQRSNKPFQQACELVRNGKIGKLIRIDTVLHPVGSKSWVPVSTPPAELDWNFWLGQTPYVDYRSNCAHYHFRWRYDYSGGVMTDWGAHHNDIAQWAMGTDETGPLSVDGTDAKFDSDGPYDVPLNFNVKYKYANGVELICHSDGKNGITFTGTDGTIFITRGKPVEASNPDILKAEPSLNDVRLGSGESHHENWLNCIKTRERCICDVAIGHRSAIICHIGNISMRLKRPLKWNPQCEEFVGDDGANAMLSRPMRAPWRI